jgi:UDP-2-acetamido-3-amino-2,3-dideoxy-glucuronate N-acetyltransferase
MPDLLQILSTTQLSAQPYALVVGNPGRQAGWMSEFGHRLHFDAEGRARCPESGELYLLQLGGVRKSLGKDS